MVKHKATKFIQKSHLKKGAFTRYCKGEGFGSVTAECIARGINSKNSHVNHMARFAKTLRRLPERS